MQKHLVGGGGADQAPQTLSRGTCLQLLLPSTDGADSARGIIKTSSQNNRTQKSTLPSLACPDQRDTYSSMMQFTSSLLLPSQDDESTAEKGETSEKSQHPEKETGALPELRCNPLSRRVCGQEGNAVLFQARPSQAEQGLGRASWIPALPGGSSTAALSSRPQGAPC